MANRGRFAMAAAIGLREDFDGSALRGLAKNTRDSNQMRRLLALAENDGARVAMQHGLAGLGCRRSAIGCCGSRPRGRTVFSIVRRQGGRRSSTSLGARN